MDFDIVVFGEITLGQCLYALGGIVAVIIVLKVVKRWIFTPKANLQHSVAYTCASCGWRGHIGKYTRNCPRCSQPVN